MRTIRIKGTPCVVSKSEAKKASELEFMDASKRFRAFVEWMTELDNDGAVARRRAVGLALGWLQPIRNEEASVPT